jgi:predicted esterase
MTTLIALHGFRQNGAHLSSHLTRLVARLPAHVRVEAPDGPHHCSPASLARLAPVLGRDNPEPHLCWWDATDDGREYRGFAHSRERVRALIEQHGEPAGLIGFSQGAILAATLAALAQRGEFPALRFVVLVAGRRPRAEALTPLFDVPLALPSLHVMGARDPSTPFSEKLFECCLEGARELARWDGPHVVPTYGPGADAIVAYITRHVGETPPGQPGVG